LPAVLSPTTTAIAYVDTHRHRGRPSAGLPQGVSIPATAPPVLVHPAAARPLGMVGLATAADQGHQERVACRLQVADHVHAVKLPVQQQQRRSYARRGGAAEQAADYLFERIAVVDDRQGDGKALPPENQVDG